VLDLGGGRKHLIDTLFSEQPVLNYIQSTFQTILDIHNEEDVFGDILAFLPGADEVDRVVRMLKEGIEDVTNVRILPLYSSLPRKEQLKIFDPLPPKMRKIVISTNIAETSVTIPNIKFVVDCGFTKQAFFDLESGGGVDSLVTLPISQASAIQRAGRAGRTTSGKCFRLYTEDCYLNDLREFHLPEMQRCSMAWPILHLKALGIQDIAHFDFIAPPSAEMVMFGLELLYCLGAIDDAAQITPLIGEAMAVMSLDPKLSRALLSSWDFGCVEEMLSIAAMLSVSHPYRPVSNTSTGKRRVQETAAMFSSRDGDHISLLNVYKECSDNDFDPTWGREVGIDLNIMLRAKEIRSRLQNQMLSFYKKCNLSSSSDVIEEDKKEEEEEEGRKNDVEGQLPKSFGNTSSSNQKVLFFSISVSYLFLPFVFNIGREEARR